MPQIDLIIVGTSLAAQSLAIEAGEAGLTNVLLINDPQTPRSAIPPRSDLRVISGSVSTVGVAEGGAVVTIDDREAMLATAVAIDTAAKPGNPTTSYPESLAEHIHFGGLPEAMWDADVLIAGSSESAAELAVRLADQGAGTVLARGGGDDGLLAGLTHSTLLRREAERRLTVLWHSQIADIVDIAGEPMAVFDDVSTPDLVFDHIVVMDGAEVSDAVEEGPVYRFGDGGIPAGEAWEAIRRGSFPTAPAHIPSRARHDDAEAADLAERHYNATITHFDRAHSDLWLLRVRPDHGDVAHEAGQYASLGLGYWEPRADGATDPGIDTKWDKLVRRSYSISSPIFDDQGYLADPTHGDTLEFYIVLVPASPDRVPGLTPRLALRQPGDRIYVGPRIVGRYTLAPVRDPEATVVFLSTGTGEAPHNAMITELLRKGHSGPIVSVVSVRYRADLGYLDTHRRLEERFSNYHYLPLVTRDPDEEKLYVQDVLERDLITERFGVELDPTRTHVYLCGNPLMIGLPKWEDDQPVFPRPKGAVEVLAERGFDIDRHGHVGNVHSEKYW